MSLLQRVHPAARYRASQVLHHASPRQQQVVQRLARQLQGRVIVHVNATAAGGGVAEIMKSFVPYLRALGVQCAWYALNPKHVPKQFFAFTNKLHNALQGIPIRFSQAEWQQYDRFNTQLAGELQQLAADLVVINDPQPLLSGTMLPAGVKKIYISHIDTSGPYPPVWKKVFPMMKAYDAMVFSNRAFVHSSLSRKKLNVFMPAIDPLALKQMIIPSTRARRYLRRHGIPRFVPLVVQVSRFDVWKNPFGLVEAHHLVRQSRPDVQTALIGIREAKDNPEADRIFGDLFEVAHKHPGLHIFFHPKGIKNIPEFTMMAQNAADVIVQNSIKEGFGLTVTEAMWKYRAVVGGPASGIRKQIVSGRNGLIAKNSEALAQAILSLIDHPKLRRRLGQAAHASVIKRFLMIRLVHDHLKLYQHLLER